MKVGYYVAGDHSVGLYDYSTEIDLGELDADLMAEGSYEGARPYREMLRDRVRDLFALITDEGGVVHFEDECADCAQPGELVDDKYVCRNPLCDASIDSDATPAATAVLIKADGTTTPVRPRTGSVWTLDELQAFVGGYIEIVNTNDGRAMVLHEEGKLKGGVVNDRATDLYQYGDHDLIVGDVVVCDWSQID